MDTQYMERALQLAEAGRGYVAPNPLVGAVLVQNGQIIGEGYHSHYGGIHAEQAAIQDAQQRGNKIHSSTLYCTLEPCSFTAPDKHNPPCTDAILQHGITEVVLALVDPNPLVSGNGITRLRDAGVTVRSGVCATAAVRQNESYILPHVTNRPHIHLKWAQSLDGCMAAHTGDSKWISSLQARDKVHTLRASSDAILVGCGTAITDNPRLTARTKTEGTRQPLRVVVAAHANLPLQHHLIQHADTIPTRLYCLDTAPTRTVKDLAKAKVTVIPVAPDSENSQYVSMPHVFEDLYTNGIRSVLVEGGAGIHNTLLSQKLYDRISVHTEPILLGAGPRPSTGMPPANTVATAMRFSDPLYQQLGTTIEMSALNPVSAAHLHNLIACSEEASCSQD